MTENYIHVGSMMINTISRHILPPLLVITALGLTTAYTLARPVVVQVDSGQVKGPQATISPTFADHLLIESVPATVKQRPLPKGKIKLSARSRVEREKGSDLWEETTAVKELVIGETAIIICDMWDKHWCTGATNRAEELAREMAPVVNKGREKGIQIIHAPSNTMPFYADWPQRQRMMLAPKVPKPVPLDLADHPLPIDDSDGGCDTDDESYRAWTRQNPRIEIGEYDGISDDGDEIYNFFKEQGIKGIIMMGVHTNMCVLNRSFAIKQMRRWGIDCLLVRDLTDTMYDPKDAPYVSHDEGTELVVQHIEKYWCPSILSKDLIAALE